MTSKKPIDGGRPLKSRLSDNTPATFRATPLPAPEPQQPTKRTTPSLLFRRLYRTLRLEALLVRGQRPERRGRAWRVSPGWRLPASAIE